MFVGWVKTAPANVPAGSGGGADWTVCPLTSTTWRTHPTASLAVSPAKHRQVQRRHPAPVRPGDERGVRGIEPEDAHLRPDGMVVGPCADGDTGPDRVSVIQVAPVEQDARPDLAEGPGPVAVGGVSGGDQRDPQRPVLHPPAKGGPLDPDPWSRAS